MANLEHTPPAREKLQAKAAPRHRSSKSAKSTYFGQYLSFEGSNQLKNYHYHGSDNSLIYKHLLTPMNNYLIQFLPRWVAPNVITLTGLCGVFIIHVFAIFYCPELENEAPWWLYAASAVALFVYQTLDNLDGKQARRIGMSSPLGLLFDHGCDALNVTVGCLTMASVMELGPTWKAMLFVITGNLAFVFATWEEYYTGCLELPVFNGPTEGILLGILLQLLTAVIGPQFWNDELIPGICNNTLFLMASTITFIGTVALNIINVTKAVHRDDERKFVAYTRILPFVILDVLAIVWFAFSPIDIVRRNPRMFFWTLGLLHSKLVMHLMLAHLCGEEYHPFRKTLVPLFYVAAHWAFCAYRGIYTSMDEIVALNEFFFISLVAYIHLVISVISEMCEVLKIPVFSVPEKKSE